ncbi:hypothetical protein D9615_000200 [Tricholomella constricta]|uniref:Uncharacterized protein n=1 Tax=Tricholomella constricta TaxID=117010 RepID=A0A8H5MBA4_9AGAR|nr:hypothetical protein D9615_000200 [Tricholomella constricta]
MTTAPAHNHRASLLSGLRTGGVRSTSASIPHTAAPGATFNVTRFASQHHSSPFPEDEEDQLVDMPHHNVFVGHAAARAMPMTAAVDGPNNRFASQQLGARGMNPNSVPFSPAAYNPNMMPQSNQMQNQALQMQMLQLEVMRIQTIQAQQMQAEMLAQAQRQQQQQAQLQSQNRRASLAFNPPATAGPLSNSFDLRSAALSAQMRRANQADQMKAQLGVGGEDQVPMTAALGGKFGSRTMSLTATGGMSRFASEEYDDQPPPPTPGSTTVISGGTSLGNAASNNINATKVTSTVSSKSDSATSWRRGGNNNSVLSGNNRAVSSPSVKVTPPSDQQRVSPPLPTSTVPKFRPQPLRFSGAAAQAMPAITIDTSDSNDNDDGSSSSAASNSSPTTPRSSSSNETSLSPREEASKKLYEGLGIGRPASVVSDHQQTSVTPIVFHRLVSQPTRQPRGPPSGAEELGPKNFATRIRRKAIGGLGMLMDARERREIVEAF